MPNVPRVFKETQDQIIIQQGRGLQIVNNAATQRIIVNGKSYISRPTYPDLR